jgi:hypothetical protein
MDAERIRYIRETYVTKLDEWSVTPVEVVDYNLITELLDTIERLQSFAAGRGMVSEADNMAEVAVLMCGLHDKIDMLKEDLRWYHAERDQYLMQLHENGIEPKPHAWRSRLERAGHG